MIDISVKIELNGKIKRFHRKLASCWQDVPNPIVRRSIKHIIAQDDIIAKLSILKLLLDLPEYVWQRLTVDIISDFIPFLDWIKLDKDPKPIINTFYFKKVHYYLPKPFFQNGTCFEFAKADEFYIDAVDQKSEKDLIALCATLARPSKTSNAEIINTGDIRIPLAADFNSDDILERTKIFEDLPVEYKIIILNYFSGVKEYVHNTYGSYLFEKPDIDVDGELIETENKNQPKFGWWSIFHSVAEDGVFGNLKTLHQTNFHQTCMYLVDRKIKNTNINNQTKN